MTPVSLCIIGRDEEKYLDRLFNSIDQAFGDYPHETVFVDTGSEDDTKNTALKRADRVFDLEWSHDFSAARNFAMEKASNDCIFFIDCDEEITSINIEDFRKAVTDCPEAIGLVRTRNCYMLLGARDAYTEKKPRICNRRFHRFEGRIGEKIKRIKESLPCDFYEADITLTHYGYLDPELGSLMRVERNLPMLLKAVEDTELVTDTALYFMLGQPFENDEDMRKRLIYLDEMKNCLNEVDDLLKKHPDVNIFDIKNSLKEYEVMYTWIYDDSKRYVEWLKLFKNFTENYDKSESELN